MVRALYAVALFASSALLFLVQPLFAKLLLPKLGGTPAVWTTCLVFFQATLLLGYGWAHLVRARAPWAHLGLLALPWLALPLGIPPGWAPDPESGVVLELLGALARGAGLPFLALAASAPLLQSWFARAARRDPASLYAASNAGSLVGLLAYPALVEPLLDLEAQARLWTVGFAVVTALVLACAFFARGAPPDAPESAPPTASRRLSWLALAAVPSSLLLAVTTHVTNDVAAVPLLWVIPLALYLLSFVVAFAPTPPPRALVQRAAPLALLVLALELALELAQLAPGGALGVHLSAFGVVAVGLHLRLAHERPEPARLTEFYLLVAAGGVLGGLFPALVAPLVFDRAREYPVTLVAAALLIQRGRVLPAVVLAALVVAGATERQRANRVLEARSFFAIHDVSVQGEAVRLHVLANGTTDHGSQRLDERGLPTAPDEPVSYYARGGPAGDLLGRRPRRVAVIGLGCGAIAAHATAGQTFDFYEIDPVVRGIAEDPRWFTYLEAARRRGAVVSVKIGDGRVSVGRVEGGYDRVVLDAFSSDAVPIHLLTREALELYLSKLAPGGIVGLHVSSRHLALARVAGDVAGSLGLPARVRTHKVHPADYLRGFRDSQWVAVARTEEDLAHLRWEPLAPRPGVRPWTDSFSNLLGALRR